MTKDELQQVLREIGADITFHNLDRLDKFAAKVASKAFRESRALSIDTIARQVAVGLAGHRPDVVAQAAYDVAEALFAEGQRRKDAETGATEMRLSN